MTPELLLEITLKSTALLFAAWLGTRLMPRSSAALRHLIWVAAFIGVFVLPLIVIAGPAWRLALLPAPVAHRAAQDPPADEPMGLQPAMGPKAVVTDRESGVSKPGSSLFDARNIPDALLGIWAVGAVALVLRLFVGLMWARRIARQASKISNAQWSAIQAEIARKLGLMRHVPVLMSHRASVAATCGIVHACVIVPSGAEHWSGERTRLVLFHELAHVKRNDCLVQMVARFAVAIQWFNPLAQIAIARISAEQERACDDLVLASGTRASVYAQELLEMASAFRPSTFPSWATLSMVRPRQFSERLAAILDQGRDRKPLTSGLVVAALVVAFFIVAPLGAIQLVSTGSPKQPGSPAIAPPPVTESRLLESQPIQTPAQELQDRVLRKWLEEDIAYIIADQETQAFRALPTNDERERFIEQFWLRRDPTPNTVENEFQEQHYLRIAYANARFESNRPGWQTDRGRMFIVHGRADRVEYHGSGTDRPYPFEVWTYRYVEGIGRDVRFEFIDPEMNGEFRLNAEPELRRKLFSPGSAAYPVPPPQAIDVPPSDGDGVTVQATMNPWWRPPVYYPGDAVREGIEGPVMAELTVDAAGEVVDARILSGPEELRKVILQAVLRWQYAADSNPTRIIQVTAFFRLPQSHTLVTSRLSLQDEIYNIGGDVAPPAVTHKVDPVYTAQAREQRHQGTVVVEAIIRTNGTIEIVRVAKSLGFGLDEQAILALKQWQFEPATRNGMPVNVRVKIEVNFNLR